MYSIFQVKSALSRLTNALLYSLACGVLGLSTANAQSPTLSIAKSFTPNAIIINGTSTLTFTISTNVDVTAIFFQDVLPAGIQVTPGAIIANTCGGIPIASVSNIITLTGGVLTAAASPCTVGVSVTGTAKGNLTNTSGAVSAMLVTGGPITGNTATATLAVVSPPILTKSFGAANLAVGNSTTLAFTLANPTGNPGPLTGLAFSDILPAGLVISTPNGLTGSCGGGTITAVANTNAIGLGGATLAAGASCTFSVNVTGIAAGTQNNVTSGVGDIQGAVGAAATATINVVAPPTISKSFADSILELFGPSTTLTFTITNPNTTTLTGLAFSDTLPTGVNIATPDNGLTTTCSGSTITAPAGGSTIAVSAPGLTLAGGAFCTISVQVVGAQLGTFINTTSPITAFGGTVVGNTATATVSVQDLYFLWFFLEGGGGGKGTP